MKVGKSSINWLLEALLDGDQTQAIAGTRKLLGDGVGREQIVTEGIEAAMTQLEAKCTMDLPSALPYLQELAREDERGGSYEEDLNS